MKLAKIPKRLTSTAHLLCHPWPHWRCHRVLREARRLGLVAIGQWPEFKYLRDYLSLSMPTAKRREALTGHYNAIVELARTSAPYLLRQDNAIIWRNEADDERNRSIVFLETASIGPLEGELQLRFRHGLRDIFFLTFSLVPGVVLDSNERMVIFVGGAQGGENCRVDIRAASRQNGEIAPVAILLVALEEIARAFSMAQVFAVSEDRLVSLSYAPGKIALNYSLYWSRAGGLKSGDFYRLFSRPGEKPLSDIPPCPSRTHAKETRKEGRDSTRNQSQPPLAGIERSHHRMIRQPFGHDRPGATNPARQPYSRSQAANSSAAWR